MATAANVDDAVVFDRLVLAAFGVVARIGTVFADKDCDARDTRALCRMFGVEPFVDTHGQLCGSGLGRKRWPVERGNAWLLGNRRLALRCGRLGSIVQGLLGKSEIASNAGQELPGNDGDIGCFRS